MRNVTRTTSLRAAVAGAALVAAVVTPGCTSQQLEGSSPSVLIVDSLLAARGNEPDKDSGVLDSDVETNGSIFQDIGKVQFRLALKDPGSATNPSVPTAMNYITVTRYHVKYIRTDGRNTQGVDVPFEFDGGMTATVTEGGTNGVFTLVRVQAKLDAPLRGLIKMGGSIAITTIAEITFFGKDQAGRDVSAKGFMTITFADFAG